MNNILEGIQANTIDNIKLLGLRTERGIQNSEAVKNSKLLKLKQATETANSYIKSAIGIKDSNHFKEKAGKLISGINFLYFVEELGTTLTRENVNVMKLFLEYQKELTDEKTAQETGEAPIENEEKVEDPTIEMLLESNGSKALILRLMNVFSKRAAITKNPQTINFFKATKDLQSDSYVVIPSGNYHNIAVDITKLTYTQFQNFVKILQQLGGMISIVRLAIGSSLPEEIRTKILGEPQQ